jgi:hypothetical protein
MNYKCSALIDQRRMCGGDPVGHRCYHDAVKEVNGDVLCQACINMLAGPEKDRLTLTGKGKREQDINFARCGVKVIGYANE